ncbi:hypothetical protein DYI25_11685 [Mesobacillus boroniphilus]|uniref:Uncharacterized protein n=1 Tax=Mesobacillus boroniphilus TaxID=308892 RepID=A0A944GXV6_9BACI|nr:hypothetical protein [Mesobacillus boroniphilus]
MLSEQKVTLGKFGVKGGKLPKPELTSDRFSVKRGKAVRTRENLWSCWQKFINSLSNYSHCKWKNSLENIVYSNTLGGILG